VGLKLIIDSDAVKTRLSLPNLSDVDNAIDSALTAAHLFVQGILRTEFEKKTRTDTFQPDVDRFPIMNGMFKLRLGQAFVHSGTVAVEFNRERIGDPYEVMDSGDYIVEHEKGVVLVSTEYDRAYVRVTYTAGFDSTHAAPEWLKEAVLTYTPTVLNNQQITNRSEEADPVRKDATRMVSEILAPHMRGTAFHFMPLYTG
jgi:hypothetical protein